MCTVDSTARKFRKTRKREYGEHILPFSGSHAILASALIIHSNSILRDGHARLFLALEIASLGPGSRAAPGATGK
jgi:hypothetical protein